MQCVRANAELKALKLDNNTINTVTKIVRLSKTSIDETEPAIVVSAIGEDRIIREAFESGVEYYIMKPVDGPLLTDRIRWALNNEEQPTSCHLNAISITRVQSGCANTVPSMLPAGNFSIMNSGNVTTPLIATTFLLASTQQSYICLLQLASILR